MSSLDDEIAKRRREAEEHAAMGKDFGRGGYFNEDFWELSEHDSIWDGALDIYRDFVTRLPADAGRPAFSVVRGDRRRHFYPWQPRRHDVRRSHYKQHQSYLLSIAEPRPARVLVLANHSDHWALIWTADLGWRAANGQYMDRWSDIGVRSAMITYAMNFG